MGFRRLLCEPGEVPTRLIPIVVLKKAKVSSCSLAKCYQRCLEIITTGLREPAKGNMIVEE